MLYELGAWTYERTRPIFQMMSYNLVPLAAIEGTAAGRIWVDDATHPRMALLWDEAHELFFAGDLPAPELAQALRRLLVGEVYSVVGERWPFVVHYWPLTWETSLDLILAGRSWAQASRRLYRFVGATSHRPPEIPAGLEMQRVEASFLARKDLGGRAPLDEWLSECWRSAEEFLRHGVAYCLLHGPAIVSWCGVEYVNGRRCGLGVETEEQQRNKGYATLVAAACVRECLARGLLVHWDCWVSNLASARVAEKLGFGEAVEYLVRFLPG